MIEILKQARRAFEVATTPLAKDRQEVLEAVAAINQAIAELESQEPVAWAMDYDIESVLSGFSTSLMGTAMRIESAFPKHRVKLLYTTPPAQPAPVQEPVGEFKQSPHGNYVQLVWKTGYVAQQGDKLYTNPPAAQPAQRTEQEPVSKLQEPTAERAWFTIAELNAWADKKLSENPHWVMPKDEPERDEPPPQRTWVDLTPEEILDMFDDQQVYGSKWLEFARAVENKLKEKNS